MDEHILAIGLSLSRGGSPVSNHYKASALAELAQGMGSQGCQ